MRARDNPGDEVSYEVIAAGGRQVAARSARRGEAVEFASRSWPDGAYEVRVRTRSRANVPVVTYLPWYKGDAKAAAAAPAGRGRRTRPPTLTCRCSPPWSRTAAPATGAALHSPLMEYEELLLERAGKTGGARAGGFVRLCLDATTSTARTQFCRAYLPDV